MSLLHQSRWSPWGRGRLPLPRRKESPRRVGTRLAPRLPPLDWRHAAELALLLLLQAALFELVRLRLGCGCFLHFLSFASAKRE